MQASVRVFTPFHLFFLLISGLFPALSPASGFPAPVEVETIESRPLAPSAWVAATVVARQRAEVAAEAEGRLLMVAEEGQRVASGEVIARLDDRQARQGLDEARAEVARLEARLAFLERELERLRRLEGRNNAARNQLDQTEADRDGAIHELAAARARLAGAELRLDRTVVRAPFSGQVVARLRRPGEWASSGQPLVDLRGEAGEIEARVPLELGAFIAPGDHLKVAAGRRFALARLRAVVEAGVGPSHLMRLRLDPPAAGHWPVGLPLRLAVPTARPRQALAIPRDAMVLRSGSVAVFKVGAENQAVRVEVTTGVADGDYIEVVSGDLVPGDRVVVRGGERLRPGQQLRIVGASAEAGEQAGSGWSAAAGGWGGKSGQWQEKGKSQWSGQEGRQWGQGGRDEGGE